MTDLSPIRRAAADQPVRTPVEAILALSDKPLDMRTIRAIGRWDSDVDVLTALKNLVAERKVKRYPPQKQYPATYQMHESAKAELAEQYRLIEEEFAADEAAPLEEAEPVWEVRGCLSCGEIRKAGSRYCAECAFWDDVDGLEDDAYQRRLLK